MGPKRWALLALGAAAAWGCGGGNGVVGGPAATGEVIGRCIDASGEPVAEVDVRFQRHANPVVTGADGRFRLAFSFDAHFPSRRSVVVLSKPPYAPLSVEVELEDGETVDLGDLPLE